jgi:hypothetical protein
MADVYALQESTKKGEGGKYWLIVEDISLAEAIRLLKIKSVHRRSEPPVSSGREPAADYKAATRTVVRVHAREATDEFRAGYYEAPLRPEKAEAALRSAGVNLPDRREARDPTD